MPKHEKPHPMLHGQHDGKLPKEMKGKKEPLGADGHHSKAKHHLHELHKIAKHHGK